MANKTTIYLDDETQRLLARIGQQEFRSLSSTVTMLVRVEAAKRGLLNRAPTIIAPAKNGTE